MFGKQGIHLSIVRRDVVIRLIRVPDWSPWSTFIACSEDMRSHIALASDWSLIAASRRDKTFQTQSFNWIGHLYILSMLTAEMSSIPGQLSNFASTLRNSCIYFPASTRQCWGCILKCSVMPHINKLTNQFCSKFNQMANLNDHLDSTHMQVAIWQGLRQNWLINLFICMHNRTAENAGSVLICLATENYNEMLKLIQNWPWDLIRLSVSYCTLAVEHWILLLTDEWSNQQYAETDWLADDRTS